MLVYGEDGWTHDEHGRQVADFRHNDRAALESLIREAMGGDDPEDDEVESILDDAAGLIDADVYDMAEMLDRHGSTFAGNCADDTAQDWIDNGFERDSADDWCEIGCWDAATAAELRDSGLTPTQAQEAAQRLIEAETAEWNAKDDAAAKADADWTPCSRDSCYTDGDPIYSACNNDTLAQEIIDAAKE